MDLITIFKVLQRKWWLLLLIPIASGICAYTFVKMSDKKYRSEAQLATGFTMDNGLSLKDERFNYVEANIKFDNLIQTMISDQVLSLVTYRLAIHDLKNEGNSYRKIKDKEKFSFIKDDRVHVINTFQNKLDSIEILSSYDDHENQLREWLKAMKYDTWNLFKNFSVYRIGSTDYISVQFISENPELSAFIVNALCDEFTRYNKKINASRSTESLEFFANLVDEKKQILDEKTEVLTDFKQTNQLSSYSLEGEAKVAQISDYEIKKQEAIQDIQALNFSISKLRGDLSNIKQDGSTKINNSNSSIIELRKKINDLNQIYINGGSEDQSLYGRIENLRERLQIEMSTLSDYNNLKTESNTDPNKIKGEIEQNQLDLKIAESKLQSINRSLAQLKSEMIGYSSKESRLSFLQEEVDNAKNEQQLAVSKYNEAKSKASVSGGSVRQILKGIPLREPVSSKTILILILSGVASFGLTAFFIVIIEFVDMRIKTPKQFVLGTKLKLSGYLNEVQIDNLNLNQIFNWVETNKDMVDFKQSLRKIRYEIEQIPDCKRILVTSNKTSEGKTFFILCMAYSISLLKKRVLIIDTNFKNNSLTTLLLAKAGVQKLLEESQIKLIGSNDLNDESEKMYTENIISKTAIKNIDVIGTINSHESPSEILSGKDFSGLLNSISGKYDYILMEGAALNDYPDTKELMKFADKVISVFSAESSIGQEDKESLQYLKALNGKLIGAVLNKVKAHNL